MGLTVRTVNIGTDRDKLIGRRVWGVIPLGPQLIVANSAGVAKALHEFRVPQGETRRIELQAYGRGNYRKGPNTGVYGIVVTPPGSTSTNDAIAGCFFEVTDDDNTAYVGSLAGHPYGGKLAEQAKMLHCRVRFRLTIDLIPTRPANKKRVNQVAC